MLKNNISASSFFLFEADNRNLTHIYRNFTLIRTFFIVVLQPHSSSEATQTHSE